MYTNAESILGKWSEFKIRVDEQRPDIIGITESWCKNQPESPMYISREFLQLENYVLIRKDATDHRGSILLYIHQDIQAEEIEDIGENVSEAIWCKVKVNRETHLIGCVYRKGTSTQDNNSALSHVLNTIKENYENFLIFGDFNLPNINWSTNLVANHTHQYAAEFIEVLEQNFMHQHVNEPTRARGNNTPSILDLIITADAQDVLDMKVNSPLGASDHAVLTWEYILGTEHN